MSCKECSISLSGFCNRDAPPEFCGPSFKQAKRRHRAKETICAEGDAVEMIFQVIEGTVKIYNTSINGKRQVIRFLKTGDWLVDIACKEHRHTAEALGDVTIRLWPKSELTTLMGRDAATAMMMFRVASQSLAAAEEQLLVLGRKSASEKVATFLLSLAKPPLEGSLASALVIDIPMQRSDIADYLGLSVETVCRKITEFTRGGVITARTATHLQVNNVGALRRIASTEGALVH